MDEDILAIAMFAAVVIIILALSFLIFTAGLFLLDVGGSDIPDQVRAYLYPDEN